MTNNAHKTVAVDIKSGNIGKNNTVDTIHKRYQKE